jgi:hypothetical protein
MKNFQLILCFLFFFFQTINQGVAQIQNDEVYEYPGRYRSDIQKLHYRKGSLCSVSFMVK